MEKTNVCRILDAHKIEYQLLTTEEVDNNQEYKKEGIIFKTLVTVANTKEHFVFVIPISETLDLKKASKSVGVKSIEMIPQKDLLPLTGYIHGGCSPIGMKKEFKTVIDTYASLCDKIIVSAGDSNYRVMLNPADLVGILKDANYDDITK